MELALRHLGLRGLILLHLNLRSLAVLQLGLWNLVLLRSGTNLPLRNPSPGVRNLALRRLSSGT